MIERTATASVPKSQSMLGKTEEQCLESKVDIRTAVAGDRVGVNRRVGGLPG
jgi:hypothetical protein